MPEHAFFHQGVAGAHGDAVPAGDARRAGDLFTAVPQDSEMFRLPVDAESLVHLHVLASLDTTSAENALVRIVAVERIGMILLVGFAAKRPRLVLHTQVLDRIVNRAIAIIVVADGAVEIVILEYAVEG